MMNNNRLAQLSNNITSVVGRGFSASALAAYLEPETYDALIIHKQREIKRLVAEDFNNSNTNYTKLIQQRQKELDELVKSKTLKEKGKSGAAYSNTANKLKEFRKQLSQP